MDRKSLIFTLTQEAQALHAEEQLLRQRLLSVRSGQRSLDAADIEALLSAQRVALRSPANVLITMAAYLEQSERPERRSRLRRLLRLLGLSG